MLYLPLIVDVFIIYIYIGYKIFNLCLVCTYIDNELFVFMICITLQMVYNAINLFLVFYFDKNL